MYSVPPICKFSCAVSSCELSLTGSILSLEACGHNVHEACFAALSGQPSPHHCPKCNAEFTSGLQNQSLAAVSVKLDAVIAALWKQAIRPAPSECLSQAIQANDVELVTALVKEYPTLVNRPLDGYYPLYVACQQGRLEIAEILLKAGAHPNKQNDLSRCIDFDKACYYVRGLQYQHGAAPLCIAAEKGNIELATLLLKYGADINQEDGERRPPLSIAINARQQEMAALLIENGANLDIRDDNNKPLVNMAVAQSLFGIVQDLINRGSDLTGVDADERTILHDAADQDDVEILKFLLAIGVREKIDAIAHGTLTPLALAIQGTKLEHIKVLVEAGADMDITYDGQTALQLAEEQIWDKDSPQITKEKEAVVAFLRGGQEPDSGHWSDAW